MFTQRVGFIQSRLSPRFLVGFILIVAGDKAKLLSIRTFGMVLFVRFITRFQVALI